MQHRGAPEDKLVEISGDTMEDGGIVEHNGTRLNMGAVDMMDPSGNISAIALQCGFRNNITGPAQVYASQTKLTALSHGFIPVADCPHTYEYSKQLHPDATEKKPLAPLPVGISDEETAKIMRCAGNNCEHFQAVRKARLAIARALYEKTNTSNTKIDLKDLEQYMLANMRANATAKAERK